MWQRFTEWLVALTIYAVIFVGGSVSYILSRAGLLSKGEQWSVSKLRGAKLRDSCS